MLNRRGKYLQIALNSSLSDAYSIIFSLPANDRILIEAGTPLIKEFGMEAVRSLYGWWSQRLAGAALPYIVADLKCIDRAGREVAMARLAGASAAVAMGSAPIETVNSFIKACAEEGIDSYVDMMNVEYPVKVMRLFPKQPTVVLLHRGVDEETFNRSKPIPYIQINKVRASYNTVIGVAGGDTIREVQRAVFNGADIVVVWKEFYSSTGGAGELASEFLKQIK